MVFRWDNLLGFLYIKHCVVQGSYDLVEVQWGWVLCWFLNMESIIQAMTEAVIGVKYYFVLYKA
jgi:hypothetical protein